MIITGITDTRITTIIGTIIMDIMIRGITTITGILTIIIVRYILTIVIITTTTTTIVAAVVTITEQGVLRRAVIRQRVMMARYEVEAVMAVR